jgi:hypothetical protein
LQRGLRRRDFRNRRAAAVNHFRPQESGGERSARIGLRRERGLTHFSDRGFRQLLRIRFCRNHWMKIGRQSARKDFKYSTSESALNRFRYGIYSHHFDEDFI